MTARSSGTSGSQHGESHQQPWRLRCPGCSVGRLHSEHTIEPDADVRQAAQQMLYGEVRRLFVEDGGRLVGVISQTDIAQAMGTGRL